MNKQSLMALTAAITLSGCASIERSTLLGASIGAAAGTGIGLAAEKSAGSALIGAGIGALFMGTMGYLAHKDKERKDAMMNRSSKDRNASKEPMLTKPEVRRIWVPEKIEDGKYYEGHFMYIIEKPSAWSK